MSSIIYLADLRPGTNSALRKNALERIGVSVKSIDVVNRCSPMRLIHRTANLFHFHTGYKFLQPSIVRKLKHTLAPTSKYDIAWVNSGELYGKSCMRELRRFTHKTVIYHNDDALGGRDGNRWLSMIKSIPEYDLCAVVRDVNVEEFKACGARQVLRVWMSYDEVMHRPLGESEHQGDEWISEVAFLGAWMPERGPFMMRLLELGIPLRIWGSGWQKAPEWGGLSRVWQGATVTGRDYVRAISGSKICLGLLSKGNRDLHTRRSVEIPYAGGLLCAERTSEHLQMYRENVEAVFWSDANECAKICKSLLADKARREQIRLHGMQRVRDLKVGNEDICRQILSALEQTNGTH